MGTTGLIYVAIVAAWAAYLVPMMLKRNDEVSRRRSAEKYSSSDARVLSRQNDGQARARYVVKHPHTSRADGGSGNDAPGAGAPGVPAPPRRYAPNRARRVAAMRRRRVLSILTLSLLTVTALSSFAMLPWWSLAIPAVLIVTFIAMTRVQLRRDARLRAELQAERRARAEAVHDHGPATAPADAEMTVELNLPIAPETVSEPAAAPPAEGLWDPVPVTLPTYVMKEKAPDRTVRTISLSGPEVFSSARAADPEPEAAPVVPEPEQTAQEPEEIEVRRAVGD
ncbi:MAG TPA: hypothetical protein VGD71_31735 [Kribbella sp.]